MINLTYIVKDVKGLATFTAYKNALAYCKMMGIDMRLIELRSIEKPFDPYPIDLFVPRETLEVEADW